MTTNVKGSTTINTSMGKENTRLTEEIIGKILVDNQMQYDIARTVQSSKDSDYTLLALRTIVFQALVKVSNAASADRAFVDACLHSAMDNVDWYAVLVFAEAQFKNDDGRLDEQPF